MQEANPPPSELEPWARCLRSWQGSADGCNSWPHEGAQQQLGVLQGEPGAVSASVLTSLHSRRPQCCTPMRPRGLNFCNQRK